MAIIVTGSAGFIGSNLVIDWLLIIIRQSMSKVLFGMILILELIGSLTKCWYQKKINLEKKLLKL